MSSRAPTRPASPPQAAAAGRMPRWAAATRSPSRPPTSAAFARPHGGPGAPHGPPAPLDRPGPLSGGGWAGPGGRRRTDRPVRSRRGHRVRRPGRAAGPSASPWQLPCWRLLRCANWLPAARGGAWGLQLPYGLIDQPESQRQAPAVLDIARGGHLLAAGRATVRAEHAAADPGRDTGGAGPPGRGPPVRTRRWPVARGAGRASALRRGGHRRRA